MRADHAYVSRQLAIAKGQLEGISKMVENDDYCIDISTQLMATISLLKKLNQKVIAAHLEGCVKEAKSEEDLDAKLKEIEVVLDRMTR